MNEVLHVTLASNGFYPRTFRWGEQTLRVLAVERISTYGAERRLRVRTAVGAFELGRSTNAGEWYLRREPNWLDRTWARMRRLPRYPLPPWRRRIFRAAAPCRLTPAPTFGGRGHATRLALVRQ